MRTKKIVVHFSLVNEVLSIVLLRILIANFTPSSSLNESFQSDFKRDCAAKLLAPIAEA
jgi:hypothetical protein